MTRRALVKFDRKRSRDCGVEDVLVGSTSLKSQEYSVGTTTCSLEGEWKPVKGGPGDADSAERRGPRSLLGFMPRVSSWYVLVPAESGSELRMRPAILTASRRGVNTRIPERWLVR
jgi:hypothetical protein